MTMRGILRLEGARRTLVLVVLAVTAFAAIPAAMVARPVPANAAGLQLCERSGSYCVGADSLDLFTAVEERTTGRDLVFTFFPSNGTWEIAFVRDQSKCVAAANNLSDIVIHACNGGSGVVWFLNCTNGKERWINRLASANKPMNQYLAGHNNGTQFFLATFDQANTFQQFTDVLGLC